MFYRAMQPRTSLLFNACNRKFSFFLLKDLGNTFSGKPTLLTSTKSLFFNCRLQSEHSSWNQGGLIGTDFRSKQTMQVIHIWILHRKLITLGDRGTLLDEALYDELWDETSNRIRFLGVASISVNRYLKEVQGYSLQCCVELDEALNHEPDEEQVLGRIGGVLWRFLYNKSESIPDHHIMQFAKYVRREQLSAMQVSSEAILEGRVAFDGVPFTSSSSDSVSSNDWHEGLDYEGRPYYWNQRLHKAQWDRPAELS